MKIPSNRLQSVLKYALQELGSFYEEQEIRSFFYLMAAHFLNMDKTTVILQPNYALSESELLKFNFAIKDLKQEKPIQYIFGETLFCGLSFLVNPDTLIPRPETEELVNWIIEEETKEEVIDVFDIGTGSGCIAISIDKALPQANVRAIDLSAGALKVANENNSRLEASVAFEQLDILQTPRNYPHQFDVIVSNPPYVRISEKAQMRNNVLLYEPSIALFVENEDPLLYYRHILIFTQKHLKSGGHLYFEINEKMGNAIAQQMTLYDFTEIQIKEDLFGRPRMIRALKK